MGITEPQNTNKTFKSHINSVTGDPARDEYQIRSEENGDVADTFNNYSGFTN